MKSISEIVLPEVVVRWPRGIGLASVGLSLTAGLILAMLTLVLGPVALAIVVGLLVLAWLVQDSFRLFIWLIVTWPILTLFVRIPLPAGIPDLSYDRALVLLLLCVILLEALLSKRRLMNVTPLDILALVYVIAQLSSRLFVLWFGGMGIPDPNGLLDIVLVPVLIHWMAKNLLVSREHLRWFLYALGIATMFICLSGLVEQAIGSEQRLFTISTHLGGSAQLQTRGWQDVPGGA